jgi:serine/threonine protein kinase
MGVVYGAEDPMLSRKVAIKTILMSADPEERAEYEPRFYQEAKAAGSLNHPNIVTIYDIGREGDLAFMAMELVEGAELKSLMSGGRLTLSRALDIAAQVAEGIAFAHGRGVIHRDIKPGNVMVTRGDLVKIMDFGIARLRTSDVKTRTGMMLGSPKYMSPEQIIGRTIDHRADIFSLGVMIYEMIAGHPPFAGPDLPSLMHAITHNEPPPPTRADPRLPQMIDLILAKALAKKPDTRYQSARELAADLRACRAALPAVPLRNLHEEQTQQMAQAADTLPLNGTPPDQQATQIGYATRTQAAPGRFAGLDPAERSFAATVPLSEMEATLTPRPAPLEADSTGSMARYTVSSRFDSTATLMKLRRPDMGSTGTHRRPADATFAGTTRRLRKSPERLLVAVAIAVALVASVAIALL